ncbi:MAG: UDP-glucose--hexose-1-phosphate uridylyltransferase [Capsulimonas sp.]|uniref:UDP-glucose--hexose-1-phosphate uridylyltransferase n=1 Tax=Capsulimonas sp. TaxID=2494211 RepID=UPI0032671962
MTLRTDIPHRRLNALTGEWVLVSPHRTLRPWQGKQETAAREQRPSYDPKCYLCAGNERAGGETNPAYKGAFVFQNDYAALMPQPHDPDTSTDTLFHTQAVSGECRVICFSPRHDWTLPVMPVDAIRSVVDVWAAQTEELGAKYRWVQVFENKGEIMGCSNPHPHGQIWASDFLPNEAAMEDKTQRAYRQTHEAPLLVDYLDGEIKDGSRIVAQNDHWVALIPFWAVWPYETLLLPRRHVLRLPDLTDAERDGLADILKRMLSRYDNLFEVSFPYSMGWHGAPTATEDDQSHWQLHAHFYPPLLRSATVKKFMVGYEMLAEAQRDLTAEQAAQTLAALPDRHYTER